MHPVCALVFSIAVIGIVSSQCLPNWHLHKGNCYRVFNEPNNRVTYVTAQERCGTYKGRLTEVQDLAELQFIGNLARTGTTLLMSDKALIGLYKTGRDNPFNVFDGSKPFVNWCSGEPTMSSGIEYCMVVVSDPEYFANHPIVPAPIIPCMSDLYCDGSHTANGFSRYICKAPIPLVCDKPNTEAVNGTCVCKKDYIDITETDVPEKQKYKPGEKCISKDPCRDVKELSVNFLVDSSDSIGKANWDSLVGFLKSGADFLPNSTRVGFVKFSNNITFSKFLEAGWSKSEFLKLVPSRYDKGETNTPAAFNKATAMFKKDKNKNRVAVLITDGLPFVATIDDEKVVQKQTKEAAKKLRSKGISLIALGYGKDLDTKKIKVIHSWLEDPEEDYFEYNKNACDLKSVHMCLLMRKICRRAVIY